MKFTTLALTLALAAFATTAHAAGGSLRGYRTLSEVGDIVCDIFTDGTCAICQDMRSTLQSNVNSVALTVTELKKEADASQAQVNARNHAAYIAPFGAGGTYLTHNSKQCENSAGAFNTPADGFCNGQADCISKAKEHCDNIPLCIGFMYAPAWSSTNVQWCKGHTLTGNNDWTAYTSTGVVARARVDGLTLEKYAADYTEHATEAYAHYVCDMKVYGNANPAPGIWGVASPLRVFDVLKDVFFAKSLGAVAKMDRKAKEAAKEADTCYAARMTAYTQTLPPGAMGDGTPASTVMKSTTPCTAGTANQWCGLPNDGNNHAAFEANSKAYIAAVGEANALFTRYQAAKKRLASAQSQYDSFEHSTCGKMMSFFNGAASDIERGLEAAYTALKCPVVTKATHWIFGKAGGMAGKLLSDEMCVEFDVEAATACEAVGLGPEDPLADTCAVALDTAITLACKQAVKAGTQAAGNQLADLVIEKAGC